MVRVGKARTGQIWCGWEGHLPAYRR